MSEEKTIKRKQFLFVDDDAAFLANLRGIFSALSRGTWEIRTAQNHAQALAQLQKQKADVVVLDIGMPVVDGMQFLRLLNRAHPGQQVVMLTGLASDEKRKECLENGALLFLEKPTAPGGYESIFAALNSLASAPAADGFRGMMRQVGLQEVIQMECLGAKSSILEIFTNKSRGRIYIHDGVIVHAEKGPLLGEKALYELLALRGGEFNLRPYVAPSERTIQGQWEFLLMEAARQSDEAAGEAAANPQPAEHEAALEAGLAELSEAGIPFPSADMDGLAGSLIPESSGPARIEELLLCSGAGEVLHDWQCASMENRLTLLTQIDEHARQVGSGASLGRFDRLEIHTNEGERLLLQVLPDRRLLVRSSGGTP